MKVLVLIIENLMRVLVTRIHNYYKYEKHKMNKQFINIITTYVLVSVSSYGKENENISSNNDSLLYNRYLIHNRNVYTLHEKATEAGIKVTDSEIEKRTDLHKQVFPAAQIDKEKVIQELLAEKYLREVKNVRENYKSDNLGKMYASKNASEESIELFNNSVSIIGSDNARKISYNEVIVPRTRSKMEKHQLFWNTELITIKRNPADCIVNSEGQCILNVEQFNAIAPLVKFPKTNMVDSSRIHGLNIMLNYLFYADQAIKNGFDKKITEKEINEEIRYTRRMVSFSGPGSAINDQRQLLDIYYRYYDTLFAKKDEFIFKICGSTDSAFIYTLSQKINVADSNAKACFVTVHQKLLLQELIMASLRLDYKQYSKPIQTNHGYFLLMLDSVNVTPEIPFDKAIDTLRTLATRDMWIDKDAQDEIRAKDYYNQYKKRFISPDTILFRGVMTLGNCSLLTNMITIEKMIKKQSVRVSIYMAEDFRFELEKLAKNVVLHNDSIYGPINTNLGTWYVTVDSIIKGGKQLPFANVKNSIIRSLDRNVTPEATKEQQGFLYRMSLASLYIKNIQEEGRRDTVSDKEILNMIKSKKFKNNELGLDSTADLTQLISENNDKLKSVILMARIAIQYKKRLIQEQMADSWKKSLIIENISDDPNVDFTLFSRY